MSSKEPSAEGLTSSQSPASMENAAALPLTLLDVAKLTWPKVPDKGEKTFQDYCKFLFDQKDDIWIICHNGVLHGMIAAKNTMGRLYVTMFVTLKPGCFEEFISRAREFFGPITTVAYLRRGRPKEIKFNNLHRLSL